LLISVLLLQLLNQLEVVLDHWHLAALLHSCDEIRAEVHLVGKFVVFTRLLFLDRCKVQVESLSFNWDAESRPSLAFDQDLPLPCACVDQVEAETVSEYDEFLTTEAGNLEDVSHL
jgi:hypothetical protein